MIKTILIAVIIILVLLLSLFLYSACVISSRCSEEEENDIEICKRIDRSKNL